jgi:hypothetical protein
MGHSVSWEQLIVQIEPGRIGLALGMKAENDQKSYCYNGQISLTTLCGSFSSRRRTNFA